MWCGHWYPEFGSLTFIITHQEEIISTHLLKTKGEQTSKLSSLSSNARAQFQLNHSSLDSLIFLLYEYYVWWPKMLTILITWLWELASPQSLIQPTRYGNHMQPLNFWPSPEAHPVAWGQHWQKKKQHPLASKWDSWPDENNASGQCNLNFMIEKSNKCCPYQLQHKNLLSVFTYQTASWDQGYLIAMAAV